MATTKTTGNTDRDARLRDMQTQIQFLARMRVMAQMGRLR